MTLKLLVPVLASGARDGVATVHARNSDDRSQNSGCIRELRPERHWCSAKPVS